MKLKQINANAVVVAVNPVTQQVGVFPLWESNKPSDKQLAQIGLEFAERCGCGWALVKAILLDD